MQRRFRQVDVFTEVPYRGNPVAVVLDAEGLTTEQMQRFANWTNLSETTFVLPPTAADADYRVRIFTPSLELPFAGHPTLGTCHAWRESGGTPRRDAATVQECAAGAIAIRDSDDRLAFAAPPLVRSGPVNEAFVERIASALHIERGDIVAAEWVDNGPGWVAVMLRDAEAVLAVHPAPIDYDLGVVGHHPPGSPHAIEVRGFFPKDGVTVEDPVTGSLNASLAQWLLGSAQLTSPYIASQGTALGRAGRVYVDRDPDGTIWIGGNTVTCVSGEVNL
ncbi:MAG: PhzF family phenazine biosynthesis protein [Ilumatobacteraceae bacterium]